MDFTIEEVSMNAWPGLKTLFYDGWVIQLANGYTNRANSVNPIYPSTIKLEEKFNYCDKLFTRHNLATAYKLLSFDEYKHIDRELEKQNYQKIHETSILVCKTPAQPEKKYNGIIVRDEFDEQWINSASNYSQVEEKHIPTFSAILGKIAEEKIVVRKETADGTAGCGYGVIGNNYVGVFGIVVKESQRRKGYGREIVETILDEAGKRGVKKSFLQVMISNSIAIHLYEKLGYCEIYRYWYRKKGIGE